MELNRESVLLSKTLKPIPAFEIILLPHELFKDRVDLWQLSG